MIETNQPAPGFTLPDLTGKRHRLADYEGQVVLLNFWSAECDWTKRTDSTLIPIVKGLGDAVIYLPIASNANEPPEALEKVAEQRGLETVLYDAEQEVADLYGAQTTPHLFLLDKEGIVRYQGAFDDADFRQPKPTQIYLKGALAALLAGEQPDPAETTPYGCAVVRHALE